MSPIDRSRLILSSNLIIIGAVAVLATIRVLLTGIENFPFPAVLVVAGCIANILYLKITGLAETAAKIFIALLLVGLAFGGLNNYGFGGPIVLLTPLIPVFTILLLDFKAASVSLALTLLILIVVFFLELNGLVPVNPNDEDRVVLGRFLTLLALCLVTTWVVWRFTRFSRNLLDQIQKQSTTDYLTDTLNRRGVEIILAHEIASARRSNGWLSLAMIDVDYFKAFNDNNGHQAGDQCLVQITQLIQSCVSRYTDTLGRFGGEEFLLIMPDTPPEGACIIAERIRRSMLDQDVPYGSHNRNPVTLTLGVVSGKGGDLQSTEYLVRHADQALYEGKRSGRNNVVSRILTKETDGLKVDVGAD